MAKLTVVAALFVALIAGAAAYTTVVTTTLVEEENPQQSCQSEVQWMTRMRQCMQWMQSSETPFLRSAVANEEEHLEECCAEVRKFSPDCRCVAIKHMMMKAQQQYGMEEQMMREKAQSLPRMCNMKYPTKCSFRA